MLRCLDIVCTTLCEGARGYRAPRISKSTRAGLVFPVGRFRRRLKTGNYSDRIAIKAVVYLAAVIEYVTADIMHLAGNAAKENKRKRINERHLQLAILTDCELSELLKNVTVPGGGALPLDHRCYFSKF